MHLRTCLIVILTATLFRGSDACAAERISCIPQWEPGKVYRQEVNTETRVSSAQAQDAQEQSVIQQIKTTVTKDTGSDNRLAEVNFESVKALITSGKEVQTYDSADPAMSRPHLQQAFGTMVGRTFTLVYDKEGKFLELRVPNAEGGVTPVGDFKGATNKQFAETWQKALELALPKQSLALGDAYDYESKTELAPFGGVTTKAQGRFDSIVDLDGRKHAKLVVKGKMELGAGGPLQAPTEGGTLEGEILFDMQRHVVTSSSLRTEMKLPANFGGMTMVSTINTKLKSVEVIPPAPK